MSIIMTISGEHIRRTHSPVKSGWATATHTVFPKGFDSALLDSFVSCKACKVVASQVKHLLAGADKFGPGSVRSRDYRN